MPLYFVGSDGNRGHISDELEVSHDGPDAVAEAVETCIERVDADAEHVEDVFDELFKELFSESVVEELGRADGRS